MEFKRNVYLKMKTLAEARDILFQAFSKLPPLASEELPVPDAVGRVLAGPVHARLSSPNFHLAAMDGLAVNAEISFGASAAAPKTLNVGQEAFYVNTGHVLPPDTNAVIMVEDVNTLDENRVEIEAPVFPWQNVRRVGEDIVATELLFPQNHVVTPYCVGALLSGGVFTVAVKTRPKVLIIPTGSELVDWRQIELKAFQPGQVLETNSFVLGKLIEKFGGTFRRHDMVVDDTDKIKAAITAAADADYQMILVLGGSSAGSEDFAKTAIFELGKIHVHGVTIMPGKPVVIGSVSTKPVFGIPGYPVSAIIAFEQFVQPLLQAFLGQPATPRETVDVRPTKKIASKLGVEEFLRVKMGEVRGRIVATPLPRGAGTITSITEADGIIRIPNHVEGINDSETVSAELLRPLPAIRKTVVIVGSHDNSLDVLADQLKAASSEFTLSSSHVGSMGGLMAIKRGVCHLAGTHLLDTEDGSYNISYLRKHLPETTVKLVHLVQRDQGLIIKKGNPKQISGIADLSRKEVNFINRQIGSGTRILLDYKLKQTDTSAADINGYQNEEFTHMAVAVSVLSGAADAGLGIYAAAKALDLDFIPVVTEHYDLVVLPEFFETDAFQILFEIINSHSFKKHVQALGGYNTKNTGKVIL
ncbi:MAG: molybdopterin biosynthesis protein [Deltaproteobacteria bacterium]|nr:molybdopterin biosynthesis protein [Deltaproteobacteria bacterium]